MDDTKMKSLAKALKVLECFTREHPERGITELSRISGLYKSNIHNIVSTFEQAGYLRKNKHNDKYALGYKLLEYTNVISSSISVREKAVVQMKELALSTGEILYFGIPNGNNVIYIEAAYPNNLMVSRVITGIQAPMYCTAIGKAMMAFESNYNEELFPETFHRYTETTICSSGKLKQELEKIRLNGYAVDNMEHEYGIKCVGVPLFDKSNALVGAMSISGPSLRFTDDKIIQYAKLLLEASRKIQSHV